MTDKENKTPEDKTDETKPPCQVTFFIEGKSYSGTSTHFHESGMLVLCEEPAPLNARLTLVLRFPGIKSTIELQGEVVWTNIYGPNDSFCPRGMGVRYLNMEPDMERLLADLSVQYQDSGFNYSCYYT